MKAVVIVAQGLQVGALACYGDPVAETPAVDALAGEGVVCDHHLADGADPEAARRGWRSGRYHLPTAGADLLAPSDPDLLAVLRAAGIRTHLVVDGTRPVHQAFADGWDEAEGVLPDQGETSLEATTAVAEEALEGLAGKDNWLLWVELGTALPPWDIPEEFQAPFFQEETSEEGEEEEESEEEQADHEGEPLTPVLEADSGPIDPGDDLLFLCLRNSYSAAVSYLDAGIGRLWEAVGTLGLADEVLFVVTADVGLPLGEHGYVGAALPWPHQEAVHVPLVVRLPGGACGGRRVEALTQGVDLFPTLAAFFGVPLPSVHGHDLLPLLRGEKDEVRPYAVSSRQVGTEVCWALRTLEWTCLLSTTTPEGDSGQGPRLFLEPDDRFEVSDVAPQNLELAESLVRTLRACARAAEMAGPFVLPPLEMEEGTGPLPGNAGENPGGTRP
jgi:arylsulfatase A-like enzyme